MSVVIRKTFFIGKALFMLIVLGACAQGVSSEGNTSNSYPYTANCFQPKMHTETIQHISMPMESGFYGYGEQSITHESDKWGPICPLDGSDLSHMSINRDIAISVPVMDSPAANTAFTPCEEAGYQTDMVPMARTHKPMHQMTPCTPQPVMQQQMRPTPTCAMEQMARPKHPCMMDRPTHNRQPTPMQQPMVNGSFPVKGTISGGNGQGYIHLECEGQYISGKPCMVPMPQHKTQSQYMNQHLNQSGDEYAKANTPVSAEWIANDGASLRVLLEQWAEKSGWRVIWNSDREYIIEAGAIFKGEFMDVTSALIRAFARANPAPQGTFYKGNKVLVINTQEAENAE